MKTPENAVLRPVAMKVLTGRARSGADVAAVSATASAAYEDLSGVLVPLLGQLGLDALTTRALHLAQREYPPVQAEGAGNDGAFARVGVWLAEQQDTGVAMDAAATILSTLGELLITFVGQPLTMRLLRKAWPDGFTDEKREEKLT